MIRFAGVDLLFADPGGQVEAFLDRHLSAMRSTIFGEASEACEKQGSLPRASWPSEPPLRLNTLYWPTGATRWSHGLFLASYEMKERVIGNLLSSGRTTSLSDALLQISDADYGGPLFTADERGGWKTDGNHRVLFASRMRLLPPRPISIIRDSLPETLWLMPLVDDRYYWRNRVTPDTWESGDVDHPAEWSEVIEDIRTALGVDDLNFPTVETEQGTGEESGVVKPHENAAVALDLVAANLGHRVVRDPDGTVRLVTPDESDNTIDENGQADQWARIAGGEFHGQIDGALVPETVRVVFVDSGGAPQETIDVSFSDLTEGGPEHEDGTLIAPGPAKTDDIATFTVADGILNSPSTTDYEDFARTLARPFYGWLARHYDIGFASVKRWQPTGFDDAFDISFARAGDAGLCIQTRVWTLSAPYGLMRLVTAGGGDAFYFGKPDQNIAAGELSSPDNVISIWKGPAYGVDDADTGRDINADYAIEAFTTTDYVAVFRSNGKWYVGCFL